MYKGEKDTREAPQPQSPIRPKPPGSHSSYPTVIVYEIDVSDSVLDWAHGSKTRITEGWIPKHKLVFNIYRDALHVFESEQPREPINPREITTTTAFINLIKNFHTFKKSVEESVESTFQSSPTTARNEE